MNIKQKLARLVVGMLAVLAATSPLAASAAQVTSRSITLGSSGASAVTTHTIAFTIPTGASIGSIEFMYCTTATGSCTKPAGLSTTGAVLSAQSGVTGFTMVPTTDGMPYISRAAVSVSAGQAASYTLSNITNPSVTNTQYWVRVETFLSTDATGSPVDSGVVAFDTTNQIVVSGTMPESLVFCVGTSGSDCSNITGAAVDLGIFSPTTTQTGTSVMSASTNAGFGYVITLSGSTLASGANTIPAMTGAASTTGTSQFGTNLKANTTPAVGANVTGLGSGAAVGAYNTADSFKFNTGDTLASASGPTKSNLFTNSYIVNVGGDQAAGVYTSTMTYICTATF